MVVRYWSDFDQVVVVVAPEDETGWWSGVGRIASAVALASSVALVNSATAAIAQLEVTRDEQIVAPTLNVEDEYTNLIRLTLTFGNRIPLLLGADATPPPPGPAQIHVYEPETTPDPYVEPTVYIIHPGNWAAGVDEIPKPVIDEDYWENQVPSLAWTIRRESPSPINEDPIKTRIPSDQDESWREPGPYYAPWIALILGERDWLSTFPNAIVDHEQWLDPTPPQGTLYYTPPPKTSAFLQDPDLPVRPGLVAIIDEDFWKNPLVPFPYWNLWPAPTWKQIDPGNLFVLPVLPCVATPPVSSSAIQTVTFTPTAFSQVVFTDVCGDPLS